MLCGSVIEILEGNLGCDRAMKNGPKIMEDFSS
jgi:hypothetical protein